MKNECIKIEGWWIFKTVVVRHNWEVEMISKFMRTSDTFHVHKKCIKCGATMTNKFVEQDTLILMGVPVKELEKITDFDYYYPNK